MLALASQTGRGACSHHGGVSAAVATVSCKDGTTADAGRGACSHHGGVKRASTRSKRTSTKVSRASHEETTAPVADAGSSSATTTRARAIPGRAPTTAESRSGYRLVSWVTKFS